MSSDDRADSPAAAPADQGGGIVHRLQSLVAEVMGLTDPAEVDPDTGIFELGMTSIMITELAANVQAAIGRPITAVAVFNHPTVNRLASYLAEMPEDDRSETVSPSIHPSEPLAIVGMACRFPGGANDLMSFWRLLKAGRDATSTVPLDRWSGDARVSRGGFLDLPVDEFDAEAFGISPREARSMDPQQRLLLEVAWEALEDAGLPVASLQGSRTGVFVGMNTSDYLQLMTERRLVADDPYAFTGTTFSMASGRLSHVLGLHGPSLSVDTACSSSLTALHQAGRSLRLGEADVAVVAGVNLMLSPVTTASLARLGALAPDGRCKTFDSSADGYGRGEGCGVLVLKRLSDAEAADDRIWAVVRGSAVNQDGNTAGLTVPNGLAQQAVVQDALRDAAITPEAVSYVEAHGTGTSLGDPLEVAALAEVFHLDTRRRPLMLGSVKTNVGHLEAAAGVCGVIKVALALRHRQIPAHLHLTRPNPLIPWNEMPVKVPTELTPWATDDAPRLAGVSSFGFSGTNAHVILSEAATRTDAVPTPSNTNNGRRLLVLSGRTPAELLDSSAAYTAFLRHPEKDSPDSSWTHVAATAAVHRTHHKERLSVVAESAERAAARLEAFARGAQQAGVRRGAVDKAMPFNTVLVYSGQGSQWPTMGRSLLKHPTAARVLERCASRVRELAGWSLLERLTADTPHLSDTVTAQPAIVAVQAALTAVWREWGIREDAVVGHSVGEIAAAYAAGAINLDQALEIAVRRGEVMGKTRGRGSMAVVGLPEERVRDLLDRGHPEVAIAAVNSPSNVVVAGPHSAMLKLEAAVRGIGAFLTIADQYAFHTSHMLDVHDDLLRAVGHITPAGPNCTVYSTVTGQLTRDGAFDAAYWGQNMCKPVLYRSAIRGAVTDQAHNVIVEIGPHTVLTNATQQSISDSCHLMTVVGSMRAGSDFHDTALDAAGALHTVGYELDHQRMNGDHVPPVWLPTRRWQRNRHWLPSGATTPATVHEEPAGAADALDGYLYDVEWPVAAKPTAGPHQPSDEWCWLLLADSQGLAEKVAERLVEVGRRCRILRRETDGADGADPERVWSPLRKALAEEKSSRAIVHLATLDAGAAYPQPGPELDRRLAESCGPPLLATRQAGTAALWTVTRGAVSAGNTPVALAQAPVWGLCRSLTLEHPEIAGGLLDLDPGGSSLDDDATAIATEILNADGEDQIAYRDGQRLVARLRRAEAPPTVEAGNPVKADASYLITGASGALAPRIVTWLVDRGARHLVLLSRTSLRDTGTRSAGPPMAEIIGELANRGVAVHTVAGDVSDPLEIEKVFTVGSTPWPPIRGVVHAAGVAEPCALRDMGWSRFRRTLTPKVDGSLVLDIATRTVELDFFVMFSSVSSIWGSNLLAPYCAANYFQDLLAHERVRRGQAGTAINWSWWSGTTMAQPFEDYYERMGLYRVPDEIGFAALDRLLPAKCPQIAVAPVDWNQFRPVLEAKRPRPLLKQISASAAKLQAGRGRLRRLVEASSGSAPIRLVQDFIHSEVSAVLEQPDADSLDPDLGFFQAGMDSIMCATLVGRLNTELATELPPTVVFEHPTIRQLAGFVLTHLRLQAPSVGGPVTTAPHPARFDPQERQQKAVDLPVAALSEEDLLLLLSNELDQDGDDDPA